MRNWDNKGFRSSEKKKGIKYKLKGLKKSDSLRFKKQKMNTMEWTLLGTLHQHLNHSHPETIFKLLQSSIITHLIWLESGKLIQFSKSQTSLTILNSSLLKIHSCCQEDVIAILSLIPLWKKLQKPFCWPPWDQPERLANQMMTAFSWLDLPKWLNSM